MHHQVGPWQQPLGIDRDPPAQVARLTGRRAGAPGLAEVGRQLVDEGRLQQLKRPRRMGHHSQGRGPPLVEPTGVSALYQDPREPAHLLFERVRISGIEHRRHPRHGGGAVIGTLSHPHSPVGPVTAP